MRGVIVSSNGTMILMKLTDGISGMLNFGQKITTTPITPPVKTEMIATQQNVRNGDKEENRILKL